ncbi:galactose/N-acetylgalactosamine-binding lectin CEL-III-like [Montipora foliosa]|uniref:galactose/N-acetylgalactosamine-binding lectin CEL-III-like n=1 Tax=Montipora foliosa TaxID=591990 RepID=UPI0035F1C4B2
MSNILYLVVFTGFFSTAASQVNCVNPIEIGEVRVLKSHSCIDISGDSGKGNVLAYRCESSDDQQLIMCDDGTIRNMKTNNCFSAGTSGSGNVISTTCVLFPKIPEYQKWKFGKSKIFKDRGGIQQEAREIINMKSRKCLDVTGIEGNGNIGTYSCTDEPDQYFYFRSRGKLLAHGRLQVQKSGLCLDVSGDQGGQGLHDNNVLIHGCEKAADQFFGFYENGELVNDKSRLCLDVSGIGGSGNVLMHECGGTYDQMWSQPRQYCDGDYCSFMNKASGKCLDVSGDQASSGSNVLTYGCDGAPDQRFKWVSGNWVTPTADWDLVGCNQNGQVTQQISNEISYSTTESETATVEIAAAVEAETLFGGVSLSVSTSYSLSKEWTMSQSQTTAITFTCENYDSGKPFVRGCMWQLQVTTKERLSDNKMRWTPQIVKCTRNHEEPKCPPFTRCMDEDCTQCEEMPASRAGLDKRFLLNLSKNKNSRV